MYVYTNVCAPVFDTENNLLSLFRVWGKRARPQIQEPSFAPCDLAQRLVVLAHRLTVRLATAVEARPLAPVAILGSPPAHGLVVEEVVNHVRRAVRAVVRKPPTLALALQAPRGVESYREFSRKQAPGMVQTAALQGVPAGCCTGACTEAIGILAGVHRNETGRTTSLTFSPFSIESSTESSAALILTDSLARSSIKHLRVNSRCLIGTSGSVSGQPHAHRIII